MTYYNINGISYSYGQAITCSQDSSDEETFKTRYYPPKY